MSHLLDRPIWHALTGPQHALATRHGRAVRFDPAYALFAATATDAPADLADLTGLVPPGGVLGLFTLATLTFPAGLVCDRRGSLHQMLLTTPAPTPPLEGMRALAVADVPAMMELVALTNPGPFARRTLEMGGYRGVFRGGALVAMVGERMRLDGFTEISAVCTHPDYRGRGLAQALIGHAAAAIFDRGETPFLHVFIDNHGALAVYQALGFVTRVTLQLAVIRRAAA